jgi:hypothetical protein
MSATRVLGLTAIVAVGLLIAASAASAEAIRGDPGGVLLPTGTLITGASQPGGATLTVPGHATVRCQGTLGLTVGPNRVANPMVITVNSFTLDGCSDADTATVITRCHTISPTPSATITSTMFSHFVTLTSISTRCAISGSGTACYYRIPSATGTYIGSTSSLSSFGSSDVTHSVPAGATDDAGSACGTSGSLSVGSLGFHGPNGTTVTLLNS